MLCASPHFSLVGFVGGQSNNTRGRLPFSPRTGDRPNDSCSKALCEVHHWEEACLLAPKEGPEIDNFTSHKKLKTPSGPEI